MGLNRDALVVFFKPWFSGTPKNAVKASEVLELSGTPIATEVVEINDEVYEFIAHNGEVAVASNYAVVMATTPTADDAVTKLAAAINANSKYVTAVASTPNDDVTIIAKLVGTEGNDIAIDTDLTNGAFVDDATELSGGQYATPCKATNALIEIDGTKYYTTKPVDKFSETGWNSIALTEL